MTFGERLQTLIISEQISRQRLSEHLHISPSTLSCYIRGKRQPEYNMLLRMAAYFDTSTDYLLGRSGLRRSEESKLSENELDLIGLRSEEHTSELQVTDATGSRMPSSA